MVNTVFVDKIPIGQGYPRVFIAGPCVIESRQFNFEMAMRLKELFVKYNIPFIYKSSFDKANRTSFSSYRGPGLTEGLQILNEIKEKLNIPVTTDVHQYDQVEAAAGVVDLIQIPAFLCRQTDLLVKAGKAGKPVNVKKGQFLAPEKMKYVIEKIKEGSGNNKVLLTERGTFFGYGSLVVDFRSIPIMKKWAPIIFDATHSTQMPGASAEFTAGQREYAPYLAKAAWAVGTNGIFVEVHGEPSKALCDSQCQLDLNMLEELLKELREFPNP